MKFIDEAIIYAKAGDGGNGLVAWTREKFVPNGGPSGGDGGHGADVVLLADANVHSLLDLRLQSKIIAENGEDGRTRNEYGAAGEDVIVKLPVGTQVFDADSGELIIDLKEIGQKEIICRGGKGGWGNTRFATATRQSPDYAYTGRPGEIKNLRLSLKLMADVGLLGFPNAGKSTLLASISAAKPKIADYPFTTLVPNLGVVKGLSGKHFVVADVPGLIEGASTGLGLGFRFLKHLERVRILCHLVEPEGDLIMRYETIRKELHLFSELLAGLPEIVVISKIDTITEDEQRENIANFEKYLKKQGKKCLQISAATQKGMEVLLRELSAVVFSGADS